MNPLLSTFRLYDLVLDILVQHRGAQDVICLHDALNRDVLPQAQPTGHKLTLAESQPHLSV